MNRYKNIFLPALIILALLMSSCSSPSSNAEERSDGGLSFRDGELVIAQFTDLHWVSTSPAIADTEEIIRSVVTLEHPDLIVLTGDIVTDHPAEEGWQGIRKMMDALETPFVVTLGNHDPEVIEIDEIYNILEESPYFLNPFAERGTEDYFDGYLPVKSSTGGDTAARIYFFNTHNKPAVREHGEYDKIYWEQIEWYREASEELSVPALAFLHIPLNEYKMLKDDVRTYGHWNEGVSSGEINSGLFSSFLDKGDVMGVFAGHDHNNDYIGIYAGVALAFGRVSGVDAYGELPRGGRIIRLMEGTRQFESWITTPAGKEYVFYYPSGFNSEDEGLMPYSPAVSVAPTQQGVSFTYYEGDFKKVTDIAQGKEVKSGTKPNFSITESPSEDHFAYDFKAYIDIPERGIYRFYTYSDDGSVLYIDNQVVVDNDGGHSPRWREGVIALEKGMHELQLLYFEDYMGQKLEVGITGKNISQRLIPDEMLYIR